MSTSGRFGRWVSKTLQFFLSFFFLELFSSSASLEVQQKTIKTFGTGVRDARSCCSLVDNNWKMGDFKRVFKILCSNWQGRGMINEHVM